MYRDDPGRSRKPVVERERRSWFGWLTPVALVPTAAALVFGVAAGYQSIVTIPSLRAPRALAPLVLRAAARGDEQAIEVQGAEPYSVLSLDVNAADPGASLTWEAGPANAAPVIHGPATAPPVGLPLLVVLPHADLKQSGSWNLVLRKPQGEEIARYPFSLKFN